MQLFKISAISLGAAMTLFANGATIEQMRDEARKLRDEARQASSLLKSKSVDAKSVLESLDAKEETIAKLRDLAATFEAAGSELTPAQRQQWDLVKTKIQLLEVFHGNKKRLAEGDLRKNRGMVRAHADGLAFRAAALEKTLSTLQP